MVEWMVNGEIIRYCNKCFMVFFVLCSWLFNEMFFVCLEKDMFDKVIYGDVLVFLGFNSFFINEGFDGFE